MLSIAPDQILKRFDKSSNILSILGSQVMLSPKNNPASKADAKIPKYIYSHLFLGKNPNIIGQVNITTTNVVLHSVMNSATILTGIKIA